MTAEELRVHGIGRTHAETLGLRIKRTRALLMHAGGGIFAPGLAGSHTVVGA